VRPTDEHQAGSTRPNFMASSPKPAGGEANILARLERDGKRGGFGKTWKNARLAWPIVASVLVIGLIGVLASLANNNLMLHRQPVLIEATALAPALQAAGAALPAKESDAPQPARVMVKADSSTEVPALVLLKPLAPPPESEKPLLAPIKPSASATSPPSPSPRSVAPARRAAHKRAAKNAKGKAAPARSLASTAKPRTVMPAPVPRVTPTAIDSDVALLSAIIIHSSRHSKERAQQEAIRCGAGKKCAPPAAKLSPTASN